MDAQDFLILATLAQAPRAPYDEVGRRVGLSGNAVKSRVARMREEGVLQGFVAVPSPGILGLQDGLLSFSGVDDAQERVDDLLRGLAELPGVRCVDVAVDNVVHVRVAFRDESDWDRIERAAISLVGKPPALRFRDAPAAAAPLAPPDARIVRALLFDGRLGLKDVASATGLSFKTARRRLEALLARGDVRIEPVLSPAEARGAVLASAHLLLDEDAPPLDKAMPPDVMLLGAPGARLRLAHALQPSLREALASFGRLAGLPGVRQVIPSLASRRHGTAWMQDALHASAPAAAPRPLPLARTRG